MIRPYGVLSRILNPTILEVANDTLRIVLQQRLMVVDRTWQLGLCLDRNPFAHLLLLIHIESFWRVPPKAIATGVLPAGARYLPMLRTCSRMPNSCSMSCPTVARLHRLKSIFRCSGRLSMIMRWMASSCAWLRTRPLPLARPPARAGPDRVSGSCFKQINGRAHCRAAHSCHCHNLHDFDAVLVRLTTCLRRSCSCPRVWFLASSFSIRV